MDKREKVVKIILWGSIALDIFFYVCFFIGFALGMASVEFGFFMVGFAFKYGLIICIISFLLKLYVLILNFGRDTEAKRKLFSIASSSAVRLLIISGVIGGIYYIGNIMSCVG